MQPCEGLSEGSSGYASVLCPTRTPIRYLMPAVGAWIRSEVWAVCVGAGHGKQARDQSRHAPAGQHLHGSRCSGTHTYCPHTLPRCTGCTWLTPDGQSGGQGHKQVFLTASLAHEVLNHVCPVQKQITHC